MSVQRNDMKIKLILVIIMTYINVWSCQTAYSPPYKFDPTEYIFIGKVVSHIESNRIGPNNKLLDKYYGFTVEIVDAIYIPKKPKKYFEIYPLLLNPACKEIPAFKQYIDEIAPIDSEVRIVAKRTEMKFENASTQNIKLVVSPSNQYQISLNLKSIPFLNSTKTSIYSYKNTSDSSLRSLARHITDSLGVKDSKQKSMIFFSVMMQKDFELRKDLYRLYSSDNDREKARIIYRLKNFRYLGSERLINIIIEYIHNKGIKRRLFGSLFKIRQKPTMPIEWIMGR